MDDDFSFLYYFPKLDWHTRNRSVFECGVGIHIKSFFHAPIITKLLLKIILFR